ncbi:MAG: tetratricopeptide repeat protein [Polaribacter sp.]|nr:tetratricopeptide repeat protein [Polaribacter sp.]
MMKKITFILAAIVLLSTATAVKAQNNCAVQYNLFKGEVQTKKYEAAYLKLVSLMKDCPSLSINIYKFGDKVAKHRFKTATDKAASFAFVKQIFEQRMQYYPNKGAAKANSDYATFLAKYKLASDEEVFGYLEKAYAIDPTKMGVKNIFNYFQGVTDRNKDTNVQLVFDTYDDVIEAVGKKLQDYSKKLKPLLDAQEREEELSKKDKKYLRAYTINSKALGAVESGLDRIIIKLSTCDRLIVLYTRDFEANKTNAKWLSRAVSRMYNKECTDDPLYDKLVEAWVAADPSPKTTVYYAGILYKRGKEAEAMEYYKKAVDQEPDAFEKAKSLYKIAQLFAKKGQKSKARNYARQALKNNPNMGKAYLLIAGLYASSANACGATEFEKRMVYTAALRKAQRAAAVDPSISRKAAKYIKNYRSQEPSRTLLFTETIAVGSSHRIKCWIGETVRVSKK